MPSARTATPQHTTRISVISALSGGKAEKVLRLIAEPKPHLTNKRVFAQQGENEFIGFVESCRNGIDTRYSLRLLIGEVLGLHLCDVKSDTWSCKATQKDAGLLVVSIGDALPESRLASIANNIVGCWVLRGIKRNAKGEIVQMPYGRDPQPKSHRRAKKGARSRYRSRRSLSWTKY